MDLSISIIHVFAFFCLLRLCIVLMKRENPLTYIATMSDSITEATRTERNPSQFTNPWVPFNTSVYRFGYQAALVSAALGMTETTGIEEGSTAPLERIFACDMRILQAAAYPL
jgi:hypothetical protein